MRSSSSAGFTYIDVMIAVVILMVGILALLSGITGAIVQSRSQEAQLGAKQIAASTMESIMSLKETDPNRLGWITIGNIGSNLDSTGTPRGIFLNGERIVREDPGPDEVIGTSDDTGPIVPNVTRQIVITDECDPDRPSYNCPTPGTNDVKIRSVEVRVTYLIGQMRRQEVLRTVLTDYAVVD
ncbi:MAG TPA: hypothetical protein PKD26_08580 [Pyrinomonadaceae bacterium]|nr:hypothetical protein [Pyrinomonadaceae bacterium]